MYSKSGLHLAAWIAMAYFTAIVQIRWTDGPNIVLALAAVWLCRHPGSRGLVGVALAGLLLDAVGNGRLGLHLGVCGMLAALTALALSSGQMQRWWMPTLMAAWLAFGEAAIEAGLPSATSSTPLDLSGSLRTAAGSAFATGTLVAAVTVLGFVASRCLPSPMAASGVRLSNQWHRLTEA
jgi:cell shape-determining protein MreD